MTQYIYVDSNIFIPQLWDRDDGLKSASEGVVSSLKGAASDTRHEKKIRIPKLCVGETITRYLKDIQDSTNDYAENPSNDKIMAECWDLIKDLDAEFESVKTEHQPVVKELNRIDDGRNLSDNDLYIAAAAIYEEDSTHLITFDDDFLDARAIQRVTTSRMEDNKRNSGLEVSNSYG